MMHKDLREFRGFPRGFRIFGNAATSAQRRRSASMTREKSRRIGARCSGAARSCR